MTDLGTQIRDYMDATVAPIDPEDLALHRVRLDASPPRRIHSTVAIAVGAACLVIALVGGAILATELTADDRPVVTTPSTTPVVTTPSTTPITTPPTTNPAAGGAPSCFERVRELGATAWSYDPVSELDTQWDGKAYVQTGIPACIDIDQPGHTGEVTWEVTWGGGQGVTDLRLVFERGVHGTVYAQHVTDLATCDTTTDCAWTVTIDARGLDPLAFVAMTRSGGEPLVPPTFSVTPIDP
ncbi:MAG TPA: hypothetical protein VK960_00935 [Acidimicrobiia bacterium]|nr:hypothetical protein [Acidimicrobiia bacterium]